MIIHTKPNSLTRLAEFWAIYRAYREHHGRLYSARIAYGIIYSTLPF